MYRTSATVANPAPFLTLAVAGLLMAGRSTHAQGVPHLNITQPGGMPGMPVLTGIERTTNGVRITWDGPPGYYRLFQKEGLQDPVWQPVGGLNLSRVTTIPALQNNAFFRVAGPAPHYAGSGNCMECHENIYNSEMNTGHTHALETLNRRGQGENPDCLPCHTVGYGLPTGFIDATATPHLGGVQCENCHGPAANHAANEIDFTVRPRVELAAAVCGGCHTGSHHPTFEEWLTTGHANVVEDMNPPGRISRCGRCHSGSSRLALLKGEDPAITVANDANLGIVCVTCHDPHAVHVHTNVLHGVVSNATTRLVVTNSQLGAIYTNQLRHPLASTEDYFLSTSDVFPQKYDPSINVCAQCHNHRGADWDSSRRPPHHSPQYNMLLGTVGELEGGSLSETNRRPASHALIEKQCVGCHMQTKDYESPDNPAATGHRFAVERFDACLDCHPFDPEGFMRFTTNVFAGEIQRVKAALDYWALVKQGGMLGTNYYGALAWEYEDPGELSSGTGPNSADQELIRDNIKRARFNLYLVLYDGSYGVHNGHVAGALLSAAYNWVLAEIVRPDD